jgi:hypothetical protein
MNASQSDTREGLVPFLASVNLTDKEGYVVKLVDATGVAKVALPTADADPVQFVIEDGDAAGEMVGCIPLSAHRNVRCKASGAIAGGIAVVVENGGKVKTITGLGSGTYFVVGYAEEDAVDGQLFRVRPMPRIHTV